MGSLKVFVGQSMYDAALQAYGNFDNYVHLLRDNDITDCNYIPKQPIVITYNDDLSRSTNYIYTTANNDPSVGSVSVSGDFFSGDFSGDFDI